MSKSSVIPSVTITATFECRLGCAACCIAPSITSPIPDMPDGKAAGVRCIQLDAAGLCRLFGLPSRPAFCSTLKPSFDMCGNHTAEAMRYLTELEQLTLPD